MSEEVFGLAVGTVSGVSEVGLVKSINEEPYLNLKSFIYDGTETWEITENAWTLTGGLSASNELTYLLANCSAGMQFPPQIVKGQYPKRVKIYDSSSLATLNYTNPTLNLEANYVTQTFQAELGSGFKMNQSNQLPYTRNNFKCFGCVNNFESVQVNGKSYAS